MHNCRLSVACVRKDGRVELWHPQRGQLRRARVVMEQHLGRLLLTSEIVHHKDGNPANDDIDNLEIISKGEHTALHSRGRKITEETRAKLIEGKARNPFWVGRKHTPEAKLKMSTTKQRLKMERQNGN